MKRSLSFVITLAVMLVFAVSFSFPSVADGAPTLSVTGITVNAGETFTVPVSISDNPGISAIKYFVYFDPELICTGITNGNVFLDSELYASKDLNRTVATNANAMRTFNAAGIAPSDYNSSCMLFSKNDQDYNTYDDGVLAYYEFTAPSEPGTYFIGVLNCRDGNTINANDEDVSFSSVNATVVVESAVFSGDVDGNGAINVRDVIQLKKFMASSIGTDGIVFTNADVNSDGVISVLDLIGLRKIIASAD